MDLDESVRRLPRSQALVLRLQALGADDALIADCLDLPVAAIPPLREMASAALVRHLGDRAAPDAGDGSPRPTRS